MTLLSIRSSFPSICQILQNSDLDEDIAAAIDIATDGEERLRQALTDGLFKLTELMWLVSGAIFQNFADPDARNLERGLSTIIKHVGFEAARRTYRDKLLVNDRNTFEDTRYEIAVTSKACKILDRGSVQLEKANQDDQRPQRSWKNSDIFGTYNGQSRSD